MFNGFDLKFLSSLRHFAKTSPEEMPKTSPALALTATFLEVQFLRAELGAEIKLSSAFLHFNFSLLSFGFFLFLNQRLVSLRNLLHLFGN